MKPKRKRPALVAVLLLAMVTTLLVPACSSAAKTAAVTVGAVKTAVDLGMDGWFEYLGRKRPCRVEQVAGCISIEMERKVKKAHDDYRLVATRLGAVLETTSNVPSPEELTSAANALLQLIEQLSGKSLLRPADIRPAPRARARQLPRAEGVLA